MPGMTDPRDQSGFTLAELLVVMMILGVISSVLLTGLVRGFEVSTTTDLRIQALNELQSAAERTVRELRMGCAMSVAEPGRAVIDVSRDGKRIRYDFDVVGSTYQIRIDEVQPSGSLVNVRTEEVIEDVPPGRADTLFVYRDRDGNPTSAPGNVRSVEISLATTTEGNVVELGSHVTLRNGGIACF